MINLFWNKFKETPLPEKEDFYSHLNIEDITDGNYTHFNYKITKILNKKIR